MSSFELELGESNKIRAELVENCCSGHTNKQPDRPYVDVRTGVRRCLKIALALVFTSVVIAVLADRILVYTLSCGVSEGLELPWSHSVILRDYPDYQKKLNEYLEPVQVSGKQWKLCYRASEHQYSSYAFHAYCDNKGPTVTLVRVGTNVFGGYADKSWKRNAGYFTHSTAAFLFSLKNHLSQQFKMLAYRNQHYALYSGNSHGPTFGGGHDLRIDDRCHLSPSIGVTSSYSNLGYTYKPPNGYLNRTTEARNLLAGSYSFKCDEYEVFYET